MKGSIILKRCKQLMVITVFTATVPVAVPSDSIRTVVSGNEESILTIATGPHSRVAVTENGRLVVQTDKSSWCYANTIVQSYFRSVIFAGGQFIAVGGSYLQPRGGVIISSTDGSKWTCQRFGMKAVLTSIAYGNGKYVAVGDRGAIYSSKDGENWQIRSSRTAAYLAAITYGNGKFVTGGEDGVCLVSADARHWIVGSTGTGRYISSISFDRKFRAFAGRSVLLSNTGEEWCDEALAFKQSNESLLLAR